MPEWNDIMDTVESEIRDGNDPVRTVTELTTSTGLEKHHVRDALRLLRRDGLVERKDTGARAVAWWHVDRVLDAPHQRQEIALEVGGVARGGGGSTTASPAGGGSSPPDTSEEPASIPESVRRVVTGIDLPGDEERKRGALLGCWRVLAEWGDATKSDFKEVFESHPAGHTNFEGWWRLMRETLPELPGVEAPSGRGNRVWYFNREDVEERT